MNVFQFALLIGAIGAAAISWRLPHSLLWIAVATASFVTSAFYEATGLPHPAAITLLCDALVCIVIDWCAREKWETRIFQVFQMSVLISVLRLFEVVQSHELYILALELCNWSALLLITGTAILERIGANDDGDRLRHSWRHYLHNAYTALRGARQTSHWRKN